MTASLSGPAPLDHDSPRRSVLVGAARSAFSFAVSRAMGTVVVTCHGKLDGDAAGNLRAVLNDLIEAQGNLEVVIDLRDAVLAETADLAAFEAAANWSAARRGRLRMCVASEAARAPLTAAGLGQLVELVTPRRLALRRLAAPAGAAEPLAAG